MSDVAIRVAGLGKQYRIAHGAGGARYRTLREDLQRLPRAAWDALRGNGDRDETFWALREVSFEVSQGEVLGIIGRNGAGKSTLLKILARITDPTTGEAEVYGRVGSLLEVGTGFHPELTGRENIYLSGAVLGMTRREVQRKFDEIVAFAEVEQFLDTPAKHYSSGMYMRLAFAVAAHLEPEILLVDEVLAVGDAEFQKKCLGKMDEVARAGRTVLFVSHNLAAVQSLCASALMLDRGAIVHQGDVLSVVSHYLQGGTQDTQESLEKIQERQGTGEIRFTRLELLDADGAPRAVLRCGEKAILAFHFINRTGRPLRGLHLAVGVDSHSGSRIAHLSSDVVNQNFDVVPPDAQCVEVHIERLPLIPGRYNYTVFARANGEIADWIKNAGSFDVEAADFYGTGKLPPQGQGSVLIDHHFQLRPAAS